MIESKCGIVCSQCEYKEKMNCSGCIKQQGNMFWGECPLATCSIEKELDHCGKCTEFPCEILVEMSYDKKQGDAGGRIEKLKEWNLSND